MDNNAYVIRQEKWREIVISCNNREPGLTKREWCRQNGIKERGLLYWQKKFRDEALAVMEQKSHTSEMPIAVAAPKEQLAFVDISDKSLSGYGFSHSSNDSAIRIRTAGYEIDISDHASPETLLMVMKVIHDV